ncbi:MAG: tol-pal system protein YbgF [Gammaproteobacteria bacterium]|jgi:tol-pal system protein YbgF
MVMMMSHGARIGALKSYIDCINMTYIITFILRTLGILTLSIGISFAQAPVTGTASGLEELSIAQRLARLESMLQSQGLLGMLDQLQQLQSEISLLRGEIETQNYTLEQLTRRQRDLYTDIDQRIQRIEGDGLPLEEISIAVLDTENIDGPPLETLAAMPSLDNSTSAIQSDSPLQLEIVDTQTILPTQNIVYTAENQPGSDTQTSDAAHQEISPVTATPDAPDAPVDPVQLQAEYQQAFNLLRQSLYDQSIRAFQQFLALHPNDKYSDNAQYWLAEAFYVKREFQQALQEYNNVINLFPQSQKVNDALLKIGFTLFELGDMAAAKTKLQELTENQPGTTVARLADERLKIINSATPITAPVTN